ncbi:MAG TPA: hypothetical protein VL244_08940 [Alphaproteobacteria bacterium]|nr:hypothetical protein [Alphaproteobacteria bacterium]
MDPRPKKNILRDDNDNPVYDKVDHRVIEMPPGEDPHFFIDQGLLHRMFMGGIPTEVELYQMVETLMPLIKFRQGGAWDAQRIKGTVVHEFINYATVALGLYGAAAGIDIDSMLEIENIYFALQSTHRKGAEMDKTYTHLPETNVKDTELGYELFETGKIGPSKK